MSKGKGKEEPVADVIPQIIEQKIETGRGEFIFSNGARYIGDWKKIDGVKIREGQGNYVYGPEEYSGTWAADAMSGEGKTVFSSGATYEGHFENNMFEGYGVYIFPDGASYR